MCAINGAEIRRELWDESHRGRLLFVRLGVLCLRSRTTAVRLRRKDLRAGLVSGYCLETIVSTVSFSFVRVGLKLL